MKGKELQELRLSLGLSQEEFGKKLGLSRSSICNMEKGVRNISIRTINLIKLTFHTDNLDIKLKNNFIKIICYIEHNLNSNNLFDLILKENDVENIYLCWKGTNDVFATVYVSAIEEIIQKGY